MDKPTERTCAICGKTQNQRDGGIGGFAVKLQFLREAGVKMADPQGRYAHVKCINKAHRRK